MNGMPLTEMKEQIGVGKRGGKKKDVFEDVQMCIGHSDGETSMHLGFRASPKSYPSSTSITKTHPCTV